MSKAREELADLANLVAFGGERVVLTRYGRPVAVLVSVADLDSLDNLDNLDNLNAAPATDREIPS